jgi:hypothetical protein
MSGILSKFTILTALAAPLLAPGAAFAQVCNPALADGSMNRCPPINDGGGARIDHRPDQRPHGAAGMHPGNGMPGNPGTHGVGGGTTFTSGAARSGGMGHGGAAGGAGGGHGK